MSKLVYQRLPDGPLRVVDAGAIEFLDGAGDYITYPLGPAIVVGVEHEDGPPPARLIERPAILGEVARDALLTRQPGVWAEALSIAVQWFWNEGAIDGATGATFHLTGAYRRGHLRLRERATGPDGVPRDALSAPLEVALGAALLWNGETLTWNGEPLVFTAA